MQGGRGEPGLQRTQTHKQTQQAEAARGGPGGGRLLLASPASTHGLDHGPVELAPGGPRGWGEGGAQALLQHVEQGLAHRLQRQGAPVTAVTAEGRKAPRHSSGVRKLGPGAGRGSQAFLIPCTGSTPPEQDSALILAPYIRGVRGNKGLDSTPSLATTP